MGWFLVGVGLGWGGLGCGSWVCVLGSVGGCGLLPFRVPLLARVWSADGLGWVGWSGVIFCSVLCVGSRRVVCYYAVCRCVMLCCVVLGCVVLGLFALCGVGLGCGGLCFVWGGFILCWYCIVWYWVGLCCLVLSCGVFYSGVSCYVALGCIVGCYVC